MPSSFKLGKPGPGMISGFAIASPVTTLKEARARMRGDRYVAAIILTVVIDLMENLRAVYCRIKLFEKMNEFSFDSRKADIARLIYTTTSHQLALGSLLFVTLQYLCTTYPYQRLSFLKENKISRGNSSDLDKLDPNRSYL